MPKSLRSIMEAKRGVRGGGEKSGKKTPQRGVNKANRIKKSSLSSKSNKRSINVALPLASNGVDVNKDSILDINDAEPMDYLYNPVHREDMIYDVNNLQRRLKPEEKILAVTDVIEKLNELCDRNGKKLTSNQTLSKQINDLKRLFVGLNKVQKSVQHLEEKLHRMQSMEKTMAHGIFTAIGKEYHPYYGIRPKSDRSQIINPFICETIALKVNKEK